jgi:ClpP class serine protease
MYWVASPSDEIIATNANDGYGANIGSIGTMCIIRDYTGKMEKEGIKEHLVFADASSDKWGDYFATLKGDYTVLKKTLNGLNNSFLNAVKENRADKLKLDKENVLTGKVYNADDAVKYGLADAKGDFLYAVKRAATLGRKHKLQQRATMSTNNAAFQNALIAAKATAFAVVDGGFLLTEEHLNNIDAMLEQNNTVISTLSGQVKSLEAKAVDSTEMAANLTKANADLVQANADLTKAKADLEEAQGKIESFKTCAGMFTNGASAEGKDDPKLEGNNNDVDLSKLAHNRTRDELLG